MHKHGKTIALLIGHGVIDYLFVTFFHNVTNYLLSIITNTNLNYEGWKVIARIIGIAGLPLLSYLLINPSYIYNRKKKTQNTDIKLGEISSRKKIPHRKNTSDSKLDDLISEIELFTNKWHYKIFLEFKLS